MASLIKRGQIYYLQWRANGAIQRRSLGTDSVQVAKEHLRQFESARARGHADPLPTKTPIPEVMAAYVGHLRTRKTAKSAQTDICYLRQAFGECCPELANSSRRTSNASGTQKRRGTRRKSHIITASHFEAVTTAQVADFLAELVRARGLSPKTANRYREIICRVFNWASEEGRVRLPGDRNPVARVRRHREHAPEIRYLTLRQIDEQLEALAGIPQLRTMVATLIYAGLRREELLWLTLEDVDLHAGRSGMIRVRAKTIAGEAWQPKTRRNRAVPISRDLSRYLLAYSPRPALGGWYFPSPKGTRWDPDNFSHDLRSVNKTAGLVWGCLDYRHTFGSQLAQNGVSLFKISKLLGNSPEICRRHYAALAPEALVADVDFRGDRQPVRQVF